MPLIESLKPNSKRINFLPMDSCQQKLRKLRKNCVYVCKYRPGQFTVVQLVLITISVYFSQVKLTFKPTKVSFSKLKRLEFRDYSLNQASNVSAKLLRI